MKEPYLRSAFDIESSGAAWEKALLSLPKPHPLQSWAWAELKSRWGWEPIPLLLKIHEDGANRPPLAAAMVLKRRIPRTRFSILYVPRGPALDYNNPALRRVVLAQLEQVTRQEKAIFIKIDPGVILAWGADDKRRSPIGAKFVDELKGRSWRFSEDQIQYKNTVELDLGRTEKEILAAMKQKTRYNIRLAARKDVVIRPGSTDDFELIAKMYMKTAERDGFAVRPIAYYLDAWKTFYDAGMAQPFLAQYGEKTLGAVIIIHYGTRATYMYGASTNLERQRMPNYRLQWEGIQWAKSKGCQVYDFWGAPDVFEDTDPLWGVWRFKDGFGGQIVRHIGAWDYVNRPFWYWIYTVVVPRYLSFLRTRVSGAAG